jgi:hypothetical protein
MRRTALIVAAALVVIGLPAAAETTFAWDGEVTYGLITDFEGNATDALTNSWMEVSATVEENFVFYTYFYGDPSTGAVIVGSTLYGAIDLGKLFDLPIGEVLRFGYFDPGFNYGCGVTSIGEEYVGGDGIGATVGLRSVTTIGPVSLRIFLAPSSFFDGGPVLYFVDVYGTFAPVSFEIAYSTAGADGFSGNVYGGAMLSQKIGALALGTALQAQYSLSTGAAALGVGLAVGYAKLVTVGAGFNAGTAGFGEIGISANIAPAETYGIDVGVKLEPSAASIIGCIDASGWTKVGPATFRVGYDYTDSGKGYGWSATQTTGGLYVTIDMTF